MKRFDDIVWHGLRALITVFAFTGAYSVIEQPQSTIAVAAEKFVDPVATAFLGSLATDHEPEARLLIFFMTIIFVLTFVPVLVSAVSTLLKTEDSIAKKGWFAPGDAINKIVWCVIGALFIGIQYYRAAAGALMFWLFAFNFLAIVAYSSRVYARSVLYFGLGAIFAAWLIQ